MKNPLELATEALSLVLIDKKVSIRGQKGKIVGIDLDDALPIKVRFRDQDTDETPWGFTVSQLEGFIEYTDSVEF